MTFPSPGSGRERVEALLARLDAAETAADGGSRDRDPQPFLELAAACDTACRELQALLDTTDVA